MNLYLLERKDEVGWDEYISMVVAAPDEESARVILPDGRDRYTIDDWLWVPPWLVNVTLIGIAKESTARGPIHKSFKAG